MGPPDHCAETLPSIGLFLAKCACVVPSSEYSGNMWGLGRRLLRRSLNNLSRTIFPPNCRESATAILVHFSISRAAAATVCTLSRRRSAFLKNRVKPRKNPYNFIPLDTPRAWLLFAANTLQRCYFLKNSPLAMTDNLPIRSASSSAILSSFILRRKGKARRRVLSLLPLSGYFLNMIYPP